MTDVADLVSNGRIRTGKTYKKMKYRSRMTMRNVILIYLGIILTMISCASKKQAVVAIMYDEKADKLFQALRLSKEAFFASDSAEIFVRDFGWAERFIAGAKFSEGSIPSVFRGDEQGFSVELPCWEMDTPESTTANVVVEHSRIDSALILAKIKGVDEQFIMQKFENYTYTDYMRNAMFSCVCISKNNKKYIVNASIRMRITK